MAAGKAGAWVLVLVLLGTPRALLGQESPATPVGAPPPSGHQPTYGPAAVIQEEEVAAKAEEAARRVVEEEAKRQDASLASTRAELRHELEMERVARAGLEQRLRLTDAAIARHADRASVDTARSGVSLTGFVHADWAFRQASQDQLSPSTNAPLNQDRISIRRARLRAALERTFVAGALELDGNSVRGATARIIGAEASLRLPPPVAGTPPLIMLTLGLFKIPFGFEVLQSDRDRLFLERSTTERGLFPGEYDAGARLQGGWRFLRYAIAVMNGEPLGETGSFAGVDPNHQKDVVGRLGMDTAIEGRVTIAAGVSGLAGKGLHAGNPGSKPSIIWQDRNEDGQFQSNEIQLAPGVAPTASQVFGRHALGADVRMTVSTVKLGETVAYGELYLAKNLDRAILPADPYGPLGRDLREIGWYAGVTQDVGQHASVGARYDFYNPDRDSTNRALGNLVPASFSYRSLAVVAALRVPAGRLIAEFDLNRNHLGRDASGAPTNLRDGAFTLRAEAKF